MSEYTALIHGVVVEENVDLNLIELCRASHAPVEQIHVWVVEGVLEPEGQTPTEWRFRGPSLRRARLAVRLTRDLDVNAAGVALALDLMDEIAGLRAKLQHLAVHEIDA
ncbi:chaperone modulator CbpM [Aquirhabdus parva]|uniref:MerR family transcriptional regulator n=1 Tax=Aquirhabdus parva TaxID=2283318 RepID=A0A345PAB7_9GAMM|nr:chaperone modulator CbpM [Aquirhabdus parva]AXI04226.1 MerR family transcriptional regulator [Aquirhabdus parva]